MGRVRILASLVANDERSPECRRSPNRRHDWYVREATGENRSDQCRWCGWIKLLAPESDPWQVIHDHGFSWDDVNALASIFAHEGWRIALRSTQDHEGVR